MQFLDKLLAFFKEHVIKPTKAFIEKVKNLKVFKPKKPRNSLEIEPRPVSVVFDTETRQIANFTNISDVLRKISALEAVISRHAERIHSLASAVKLSVASNPDEDERWLAEAKKIRQFLTNCMLEIEDVESNDDAIVEDTKNEAVVFAKQVFDDAGDIVDWIHQQNNYYETMEFDTNTDYGESSSSSESSDESTDCDDRGHIPNYVNIRKLPDVTDSTLFPKPPQTDSAAQSTNPDPDINYANIESLSSTQTDQVYDIPVTLRGDQGRVHINSNSTAISFSFIDSEDNIYEDISRANPELRLNVAPEIIVSQPSEIEAEKEAVRQIGALRNDLDVLVMNMQALGPNDGDQEYQLFRDLMERIMIAISSVVVRDEHGSAQHMQTEALKYGQHCYDEIERHTAKRKTIY